MPVWHEATRDARASGALAVVGIALEQHPERSRLYAQWQGFDWPILWDPFGLAGEKVVPREVFVDEHGMVRAIDPRPGDLAELLSTDYPAPTELPPQATSSMPRLLPAPGLDAAALDALSTFLWWGPDDEALRTLAGLALAEPDNGPAAFRAGVAYRMRHDGRGARPEDFEAALGHWRAALALDPSQYIWRRRLQQYGPRLDKPYPFYTWVDRARAELLEREVTPIELGAPLTGSERAGPSKSPVAQGADEVEPDPEGSAPRDDGWVAVSSTAAFDTKDSGKAARVYLFFEPNEEDDVHWNNEVEPMRIWLGEPSDGARIAQHGFEIEVPPAVTTRERRAIDFEIELPVGLERTELEGYALFHACRGVDGKCVFLRRDFSVSLRRP